jgi:transposase
VPEKQQQIELVEKPVVITKYRDYRYWCESCKAYHDAPIPPEVAKAGLFGPKLMTTVGYLKGRGHMSYTTVQAFCADVLGVKVARSFLVKQVKKVSAGLEKTYQNLCEKLPTASHLHADETGWKEHGEQRWAWCFRALYGVPS